MTAELLTPASQKFFVAIRVLNTSRTACRTGAYPGVAVLSASGGQVFQARRTLRGYGGGLPSGTDTPPFAILHRDQVSTAILEGPSRNADGDDCPREPALLVTPPNTTRSVKLSVSTYACQAPEIHPLVRGRNGS